MKRQALIYGGSSGIGLGIARCLASQGYNLLIVSRNERKLLEAKKEILESKNVEIEVFQANTSIETDLNKSITWAESKGQIDILVNNTGGPPAKNYQEITNEEWRNVFESLFLSAVTPSRRLGEQMAQRGWGRIITVGSTVAKEPTEKMISSAAIRAALTNYMKSLSRDLAKYGVTVNTIAIGGINTERVNDLTIQIAEKEGVSVEDIRKKNTALIPAKRLGLPSEAGAYVAFLCSDDAGYITGTNISIDGGLTRGAML